MEAERRIAELESKLAELTEAADSARRPHR
jgi:uncharacterized coiled-coil protein SlyX